MTVADLIQAFVASHIKYLDHCYTINMVSNEFTLYRVGEDLYPFRK